MTGFILFINFVLWSIVNVISLSSSLSSFPSSTTTTFSHSLGINIHNLKLNNSVVSLIKNSFGFVRTDLTWEKVERVKGIYDFTEYDLFIEHLTNSGMKAQFHYLPLHVSKMGKTFGGKSGDCPITEDISDRIVRLPFFNDLNIEKLDFNIFYEYKRK